MFVTVLGFIAMRHENQVNFQINREPAKKKKEDLTADPVKTARRRAIEDHQARIRRDSELDFLD